VGKRRLLQRQKLSIFFHSGDEALAELARGTCTYDKPSHLKKRQTGYLVFQGGNMSTYSRYCDACGAANRVQARFCVSCGKPLQIPTIGSLPQSSTGLLAHQYLLKDRYSILHRLGQGGFGAVYKAEDTLFGNRLVAVKEMSQSNLSPQQVVEATHAFKREAQMLANLNHPNLPRVYDYFGDAGRWYLVMDFIEGETLEEYLNKANGERLPVKEVLNIGLQLCAVLDYLHNCHPSIIFRDLKPANVMRTSSGHLYLIDFGIARHFKAGQTKDTLALGSPGYAAPEQYGKAQTTPITDIYSLGATLHQLLSGKDPTEVPFQFAPLQPSGQLPPDLNTLIMRMVETQVSNRPRSITFVKEELYRIATAKTKEQCLQEGKIHYKAHHYEDALSACEEALRLDSHYAVAYKEKGDALHRLNRYQEALEAYQWALRIEPYYVIVYSNKALTLCSLNRYQEALAACELALRLDPNCPHAHRNRGLALYRLNRYQEALSAHELAIQQDAEDLDAYTGVIAALKRLNRHLETHLTLEQLLAVCERILQLDPDAAEAYLFKSSALFELERDEEAISASSQALRLDPYCAEAYNIQGSALGGLHHNQEALAAYEQALRLNPYNRTFLVNKGFALYELGRYEEALALCEQALRLDSDYVYAYHIKSTILESIGKSQEAEQARERARQLGFNI
jgi:serine/threonine protein kinase